MLFTSANKRRMLHFQMKWFHLQHILITYTWQQKGKYNIHYSGIWIVIRTTQQEYEVCSLLTIVTMKCKATIINIVFLHYNLCQDIMLVGSLSCSFTLITCLTNFYSYYYSWFTFKSNNNNLIFISELRQVGGFLRVLRFPPPIKLTTTI
jgi:hypothetical protein